MLNTRILIDYNMSWHKSNLYDNLCDISLVAPNLYTVDQCFGPSTFSWLCGITETSCNEFFLGDLKKRLQLKANCHDQARLNQIGCDQISALEQLTGLRLHFVEAKFWLDLPQFGCQVHSDAPDLLVNYQIYIHTSPGVDIECVGAEFLHVKPPVQVQFKPNHGYINVNTDLKPHWVNGGHGTRTSVMFQYARV